MTEIMLAARNDNVTVLADPLAMLEAGNLVAYRLRGNGTARVIQLLPVGSTHRDTAEWIYDQVEDGRSVRAVAREIHSSEATVRRFLLALEITEEVEAGDWDDTWRTAQGFDKVDADASDELVVTTPDPLQPVCDEEADTVVVFRPSPAEKAAGADAGVFFS